MWQLFLSLFGAKKRIYLDYASATPVLPSVVRAVADAQKIFGNPGSIHAQGVQASQLLARSRERIAHEIGCKAREIVFTSGGTEANNLAILGFAKNVEKSSFRTVLKGAQGPSLGTSPLSHTHWIVSAIEHPSVLECFAEIERLGGAVDFVDSDAQGIIKPEAVARLLRPETVFVSIGWTNSEIGIVQPIAKITRILRSYEEKHSTKIIFHSDAGQAPLYLGAHVHSLGVDLLTLDSGKLYGPRGIGGLYLSDRVTLAPLHLGGKQERGLRAGTENVALAVGFAEAFAQVASERAGEAKRLQKLRDDFAKNILTDVPGVILNTDLDHSLPHILNISIPNINSEYLVLALDHAGIALSTKSACKEGDEQKSHVVAALKEGADPFYPEWRAKNTVRFSMGRDTTQKDLRYSLATLIKFCTT